jgi:circadian clock protein KaiB
MTAMTAQTSPKMKKYVLRLYIANNTAQSAIAYRNLKKLCSLHLAGQYSLEVIDLLKHPELAKADQILAVPTLVREMPVPIRKFIGTLTDTARVLVDFEVLPPAARATSAGKVAKDVR